MSLALVDTHFSSVTGSFGRIVKGASRMGQGWRQAVPTSPPVIMPSRTAGLRGRRLGGGGGGGC